MERRGIGEEGKNERKNAMPQVWGKSKGSLGDHILNQQKTFENLKLLKNNNTRDQQEQQQQ